MLEQTDHYKLGVAAQEMAADSLGKIWFLGTSDEIFTHDLRRRTTEFVASANDASSVALTPSKAVYGTWGGEIWSVNFDSRKVEKLLALPRSSFVAKLVVDSGSGMIFCSTKSEIFGIGIDGSVSHRIPIEFVEDLIVVGDGLWFLKQGRISLWNIRNNHVSMVSKSVNYILLRHAMNGLIAGLGGGVDLLNEEGQIVESIPGSVNQFAWDARNCFLGYANRDKSINFCRARYSVQTLDTYRVSNASSIVSVKDFGFVVSYFGDLLIFQNTC